MEQPITMQIRIRVIFTRELMCRPKLTTTIEIHAQLYCPSLCCTSRTDEAQNVAYVDDSEYGSLKLHDVACVPQAHNGTTEGPSATSSK